MKERRRGGERETGIEEGREKEREREMRLRGIQGRGWREG